MFVDREHLVVTREDLVGAHRDDLRRYGAVGITRREVGYRACACQEGNVTARRKIRPRLPQLPVPAGALERGGELVACGAMAKQLWVLRHAEAEPRGSMPRTSCGRSRSGESARPGSRVPRSPPRGAPRRGAHKSSRAGAGDREAGVRDGRRRGGARGLRAALGRLRRRAGAASCSPHGAPTRT